MTEYTLQLELRDAEGTVVWEASTPMEITTAVTLGFGMGEYGDGGYGDETTEETNP